MSQAKKAPVKNTAAKRAMKKAAKRAKRVTKMAKRARKKARKAYKKNIGALGKARERPSASDAGLRG
jgi:hypothetical protein